MRLQIGFSQDVLAGFPDAHPGLIRAVKDFVAKEPYELLLASENDDLQWAIKRKTLA